MSLVILSKSPTNSVFSKERIRLILRKCLRINRGPDAVLKSLIRGLDELQYPYVLNPKASAIQSTDVVFVNGSIPALRFAISAKRDGQINTLVAGPNLVITPDDFDGIINSKEIDRILQPSDWVRDFYGSINAALTSKIFIWPSGVEVPPISEQTRDSIVVYVKNDFTDEQLGTLAKVLQHEKSIYLMYGKFNQSEFFTALESAKAMIYLSHSESQGIALQEAWARDVPTLVWDRGYFEHGAYRWEALNIASPYINDRNGTTFTSFESLPEVCAQFLNSLDTYSARTYVQEEVSDVQSAKKLIELIEST